jgi:hypothetical protein
MAKNVDNFVPHAVQFTSGPVVTNSFTETRIPLYWGPGLSMLSYPTYNPPDITLWRQNEALSIPETVRLMLGVQEQYDTDAYQDDNTDPPVPPVPPPPPPTRWEYIGVADPSYTFTLRQSYFDALGYPNRPSVYLASDTFPLEFPYEDDPYGIRGITLSSSNSVPIPAGLTFNIKIYNTLAGTGDIIYEGPLDFAGTIRTGGRFTLFQRGSTIIQGYGSVDDGEDVFQAARCYYLVQLFSGPAWRTSEVPPAARNDYGCSVLPPPFPPP